MQMVGVGPRAGLIHRGSLCAFIVLVWVSTEADAEKLSFSRDVRPILSNACFKCHGPDADNREAGLRLDSMMGATRDLGGYQAVAPGEPDESALVERITSEDESERMPPVDSEMRLTSAQVRILTRWIREGANYDEHWAFRAVSRPDLPEVTRAKWCRNPIDRFVLARLESLNIQPSEEADRRTLIRRAFLDLTGLPPTPQQVNAFVADRSPTAYRAVVEQQLASPHYGERWGRHWLDQARYADTNGYTVDSERTMWPYRDWVIGALNRDMPFDEFTVDQLAGDLLPDATIDQLVATGFHRNTLVNQEGGADREQFRNEVAMDRVDTTGVVWMGLTIGCARCHNHKYDPISQQEYYELFAFFNSAQDANSVAPVVSVARPDQRQRLAEFDREINSARQRLNQYDAARNDRLEAAMRDDGEPVEWTLLKIESATSEAGATFESLGDGSLLAGSVNGERDLYTLTGSPPLPRLTAIRLEVLTHPTLPKGGPGRAGNGNFVLNEIHVESGDHRLLPWIHASADHSQKDYDVLAAIDGNMSTGWAINVTKGRMNVNRTAQFVFRDPIEIGESDRITVKLRFGDKPSRYNIGRFRVAVTSAPHAKLELPDPDRDRLTGEVRTLEAAKRKYAAGIPTAMVMREMQKPRSTHVLIRGDFLRHGPPVLPDVPDVLPSLPASEHVRNRLDLARWLVTPNHPLTARVAVNRMWMQYFGRGLVETEDDFGMQGSLPSHPDLLNWLAAEFCDSGWSMKHMHELIVTSATYCQESHARPDLADIDPVNRLLARQVRLRVDAEIVRDLALAVSGLLNPRVGGPSVRPPQPAGVYAFTQRSASWKTSKGPDGYRRGMYTFFMRSAPYPMLTTFDSPRFNNACTRRSRSNTPIQALTMANDAVILDVARALGRRIIGSADNDNQRIRIAFELCFSRPPDDMEIERVRRFLARQQAAFAASRDDAVAFAGDQWPSTTRPADAAAWTSVSRLLINLDEFITRE